MNIVVTGGGGYLGSALVPMLLEDRDNKVTVIDNFMYGQLPLVSEIWRTNLNVVNKSMKEVSLSDFEPDAVIHLAAIVGAPLCAADPVKARETNLMLVYELLKQLPKSVKFIFPTTNSGYGIGQASIECDETTPITPVSLYGILKVAAEKEILKWGGVSLRFASLFGVSTRMRDDLLVNDFVRRAIRDKYLVLFEPHFKRNYLHVRDAARSVIHTLGFNYSHMMGEPYNVGLSDSNLSKMELATLIKTYLPGTAIIEHEITKDMDKRNYIVSNKKIEKIGFGPRLTLDEGIKELIKYYKIVSRMV